MYKFLPIFKSTIWGGTSIAPFKGAVAAQSQIGESWEISGVKDCESIVAEGPEAGLTLSELIMAHGESLLGRKVMKRYGTEFPLLVKFIDARQDLSVQVHPNDQQAAARHNGSRGKTEMWYVVNATSDAHLCSGFKRNITAEEYCKAIEDGSIVEMLAEYNVKPGDLFFLPAG
ncbi:MAG: class I mannose-6-phosphate isomerase, partial [Muribaculum sp.]|nr:class I mannose-6-phosphate isomerase [Muribaculum sp.]